MEWMRPVVIGCCALLFLAAPLTAEQAPPLAPVRPVVDEYHGVKISDPYRYMEDLKDEEVRGWMKTHADHAASVLHSIPGRKRILARIEELERGTVTTVDSEDLQRVSNGTIFFTKRLGNEDVFKLYVKNGLAGTEKLLVDPEVYKDDSGTPFAINYFVASPTGRYVAYGVSGGGSEDASMYIIETATGKQIGEPISRARFGAIGWLDDESGLFYWRSEELGPDSSPIDRYRDTKTFLHKLGTSAEDDAYVFGRGVNGVDIPPTEFPIVATVPGSPYAIGFVTTGVSPEYSGIYTAPLSDLNGTDTPWKKFCGWDDKVSSIAVHGDDLYLLTFKDAPRSKVTKTSLSNPDVANAQTVIPHSDGVIRAIAVAQDGLYAQVMDGSVGRLQRLAFDGGGVAQDISIPLGGTVQLVGTDPGLPGTLYSLEAWTRDLSIYEYNPSTGTSRDTKLQPLGEHGAPPELVSVEVKVKSHDGVEVPLSIIYRDGMELDGKNPTMLFGYGAYSISYDPYFSLRRVAWCEQGGIYAVAHVRGGGEYGEEWHQAGFKTSKPNTWKDVIACAEYMSEHGYSSPEYMSVVGGSAGGILVGRAITERPDLFAAAIPQVGCLDMLRAETTPNGVPNIPEFGTVTDPVEFEALLEMSAYHHVQDGVNYPAVMLTHGMNDPRVEPWNSAKMAARLLAATSSEKPILMRIDFASGHGIGDTRRQIQEELADMYSFVLWQCGVDEFQPTN